LNELFTSKPILSHFHPTHNKVVETYASCFEKCTVLSQWGKDSRLHPIAFSCKEHSPVEINYEIIVKEMVVIVAAFREWEHPLNSIKVVVNAFTDYKYQKYFNTTKVLTPQQARWVNDLAGNLCNVINRLGKKNGKPDVLSRYWDHHLREGDELEAPQL
jgi:hypothetical protein